MSDFDAISSLELFRDVPIDQRDEISAQLVRRDLLRGETLVVQGDPSTSMFVVLSGRFTIHVGGVSEPIGEIGVGQPIGEIGFFAGLRRSATVIAARDATVLELDRTAFSDIARRAPQVYDAIVVEMARRLGETTSRLTGEQPKLRTVAVICAGDAEVPNGFIESLRRVLDRCSGRSTVLSTYELVRRSRAPSISEIDAHWLNALEADHDFVVYVADKTLTAWSQQAIRQADGLVIIATGDAACPPGEVERWAFAFHPPANRRLVRIHPARCGIVEGTAAWLSGREVVMHHHVALTDDADMESLCRFLTGQAMGFVAGAGGGFGPAHVGIFQAFEELGVTFDIVGGTSVGAAIMAGFAFLCTPQYITDATDDIFVKSRGFKRPTLPRYALLDHFAFDAALKRQYRGCNVEDCWRNFFSVSTDLSSNCPHLHRSGPLWRAVRASSSLPGVLPPVYEDGHMLVDGALVDLVPLGAMRQLKSGPNVIVHFGLPTLELFDVDYDSIPGRWRLLASMLSPFHRKRLPRAPSPVNVLRRSMFANQRRDLLPVGPHDLVIEPPAFPGSSFMEWDNHRAVYEASYQWARVHIEGLMARQDPALNAILVASGLR